MKGGACSFGCGATVRRFTDDVGQLHQVDDIPYRGDVTAPSVRHRLWRHRSKWTGWISVPYLGEEVRPTLTEFVHRGQIHLEHDCATTPTIRKPITGPIRMSVHNAHTNTEPIRNEHARTHVTASPRGPF